MLKISFYMLPSSPIEGKALKKSRVKFNRKFNINIEKCIQVNLKYFTKLKTISFKSQRGSLTFVHQRNESFGYRNGRCPRFVGYSRWKVYGLSIAREGKLLAGDSGRKIAGVIDLQGAIYHMVAMAWGENVHVCMYVCVSV